MKKLFSLAGFAPYVFVLWLNAFVDLGHKILIQNTVFKVYDGYVQVILTAVVNSLILLPFIVLFSPAGFCSDRWPKNQVMRFSAWLAIGLTLLITLFYYLGWFWPAFAMTFLLAAQSAIYSPAKYGYIKALVGRDNLTAANGVVQATTIVSILAGTLVFSMLFERFYLSVMVNTEADILTAFAPLGWLLVLMSIVELLLARRLPQLEQPDSSLRFRVKDYLLARDITQAMQPITTQRVILIAIIGLAGFWSVSQVMLAAFPAFAKAELGVTNTVVIQGVMAVSGIGIVIGALFAERICTGALDHGQFELSRLPYAAVGIALCLLWLPLLPSMLWHGFNFFVIGVLGGIFIVPLNAFIQGRAAQHDLGRVLAGNNLIQNIAMFSFLILTAIFAFLGTRVSILLLMMSAVALVVCAYSTLVLRRQLAKESVSPSVVSSTAPRTKT